ncbi:uncharacterized protein ACIGJ3_016512 [Trichechus inunguis]
MGPSLPEPQNMVSSSNSSVFVAQEPVLPSCDCKKAKHSTDLSISSGSLGNISSLSHLPVFSEGTTGKFQSHSLPVSPKKQSSVFRNQDTPLPSFWLPEPEKSKLFQNLAATSPLSPQSSFINSTFESPNLCKQQGKTKNERRSKSHLTSDCGPNSVFKERPQLPGWASIQLSPLARWELEGHMAWKVYTLREQTVPLAVRESWAMLNYLIEVQGVPKPEKPQTQSSTLISQNTERNTNNKSPDLSSLQLHVNIGVESGLNRTQTKISQSLIPCKQPQPGDGPRILGSRPLVTSTGTPSPISLGADKIQEETILLQKHPNHVLELSIEQRVIGLPEERVEQQKTQVTDVELTPKLPYQDTDSIKVTPLALLQVMDSMGMISESHSEVTEFVGLFPRPSNQVVKPMEAIETVSVSPEPPYRAIKSVEVIPRPQHKVMESKGLTSRSLNQATDNVKVTPVALLQVMDSMGMINKPHQYITESVGMTSRSQFHIMDSVKMDHKVIKSGTVSPMPQHAVIETVDITSRPQHKVMESVGMTSRPQSQVMEPLKITTGPTYQNTKSLEMFSRPLYQVIDDMKVTPVALLQAMDFMGIIPPGQPHAIVAGYKIYGGEANAAA